MYICKMDVSLYARLIPALLSQHNRVSLPGMGSFVAAERAPKLVQKGRLIKAPGRVIRFSVDESWNDELLESAYAAELNLSMPKSQEEETASGNLTLCLEQARREIAQLVVVIKIQFRQSGSFEFPRFGTMKSDDKDQVTFLQSQDCPADSHAFGLPDLAIKPLSTLAPVEELFATKKRKRISVLFYILLGVLLWLVVLTGVAYLFRDQLSPVFKMVLYNREQREQIDTQTDNIKMP